MQFLAVLFLALRVSVCAQNWTLKISSNVELRTWKLTTKADKEEKALLGASITLSQGGKTVNQSTSDGNGDFVVYVPANGEYVLTVSYPGCNAKKFLIITTGVPPEIQNDNFKPSFSIGGFVMAKPFPGIDYSGLQQTLVKVIYKSKIKNFDDDEPYTDAGLGIVMKISDAENILINNFCNTNKAGDAALVKPDCPLAKMLYEKAIAMIPGEQYPVVQLAKVGDCLKAKEEAAKKAEEANKAKTEQERIANEKAAQDKLTKEQADKEKQANAKAQQEKLATDKAAQNKIAQEKATQEKLAKEKADKDKLARTKAEQDKTKTDKAAQNKKEIDSKNKTATDKKLQDEKIAKEKAAATSPVKKKAEEKNVEPIAKKSESTSTDNSGDIDKSDSKYRVPQVLGANKYKETLTKAEGFFKMKRYAEAKLAYEDVLKIKPDDVYATNKLAETNTLLAK